MQDYAKQHYAKQQQHKKAGDVNPLVLEVWPQQPGPGKPQHQDMVEINPEELFSSGIKEDTVNRIPQKWYGAG
ncbi:MAG: hypothetical protein CSB34_07625 [Desulfobulbus propionicus]|nr:MAG: hypothetical protein CSB34_07625 [Desulfobulbus propionicus]